MRRAAALLDSPVLAVGGLALVLLADGTGLVRLGLCASLVHECGHLLVYWLLLHWLPPLRLTMAGIGLQADGLWLGRWRETLLLAAGPLANLAAAAVCAVLISRRATYGRYFFLAANLCVGLYNLLPVGTLDGGRLARLWCPAGGQRLLGLVQCGVVAALGVWLLRNVWQGSAPLWLALAGAAALAALLREGFAAE